MSSIDEFIGLRSEETLIEYSKIICSVLDAQFDRREGAPKDVFIEHCLESQGLHSLENGALDS